MRLACGTGKTLIMCIAAHEMKRLNLAHKPMIIGLKANVAEIAATYQAAYPNARILYASEKDFSTANRVRFFNNIKNNDYDCVIMSHDQFGKIPQSPELQQRILQAELDTVEENLEVLRQQGKNVSRAMLKGLEKRKHNLEAKLEKVEHAIKSRTDDVVDFKQMGIDHIFIDESHQFKNLTFNTRHDRVAGLGNSEGSQTSSKCRSLPPSIMKSRTTARRRMWAWTVPTKTRYCTTYRPRRSRRTSYRS